MVVPRVDCPVAPTGSKVRPTIERTAPRPLRLIAFVVVLTVTWLYVLPKIGGTNAVKNWIEPLRDRGINPSGMYYTDVFELRRQR